MTGKIKIGYQVIPADGKPIDGALEVTAIDSNETMEKVRALCREYVPGDREHVRVFWKGKYTSMFVAETGRLDNLPMNRKATEIYQNNIRVHAPNEYNPATMPWIAGPVILFDKDVWF